MLKCGFYEMDITPNLGENIPGGFRAVPGQMIHDKLYAKAFAVQGDADPIVMVVLDTLMLDKEFADPIRQGIAEAIGVTSANVSVGAVHIHTGGPVVSLYDSVRDDAYCEFMVKRAVTAGIMAYRRMADARIGAASSNVEGISFNRRFRMKSGKVVTNPGFLNPDIVESVDIIDPELLVLRVDHADGTPMGVIMNYTLHTDTVGRPGGVRGFSADYPAVACKALRKELGQDLGFLFLQGTSGNVNHFNVTKSGPEQLNYQSIGEILAKEILALYPGIETNDTAKVVCTSSFDTSRTRRPTQEECDAIGIPDILQEMLPVVGVPDEDVTFEMWTAMIGDITINMLPGELFCRFGLDVKTKGGCKYTLISELSNTSIGYVYTKEAELQGGYEATPSTYVRMNSDTGYKIVDGALENMKKLQNL